MTQAIRPPARTQATTKEAPPKASTSQARTQASRKPARTQASNKTTSDKASFPQTRSQVFLQAVRTQTDPKEVRPPLPKFRPVSRTRTMECLVAKDRALDRARQVREGVFASRSRAGIVAKARLPGQRQPVPEALPTRSTSPLPSGSPALPSGGQLTSKTRHGAGVAALSSKASEPRSKPASGPVDNSSLPAGVYEKIRREGSHGPAFTLKKVSWKFQGGWENVFSPPEGRVVLSPEPEVAETNNMPAPVWITPAPRYSAIGKTPVRPDCARPRRRHMAPPMPASPPRSVHWPSRSETRFTCARSVAKEEASEGHQMSGLLGRLQSLQLSHKLGSVDHRVPAHGSAALKSAFRTGSRKAKAVVRFADNNRVRTVSRWVTDSYSDHRSIAGVICSWRTDPEWDPNPDDPSDNAHIRVWTMHPEECNHHLDHMVQDYGDGEPIWANCRPCAPHLREISWTEVCPVQTYRMPWIPELGMQGKCTCKVSGTFDCPRKLYRKRLDFAHVELTCRGPKSGKLKALRLVLARMNWARGVAVIPTDL
jgi:hypothetical protein